MSTTTAPAAWGTREWFTRQFSAVAPNDPTAYYSHAANGYQRFRHDYLVAQLQTAFPGRGYSALLDVGCGAGELTALAAQRCDIPRAVGIDFAENVIEHAQRTWPGLEFRAQALPELPFADGEFDVAIVSEVLYYLSEADRRRSVAELGRVIRPGGVLLFTTRLGGVYSSMAQADALLSTDFTIHTRRALHNRLYQSLSAVPRGLLAARAYVEQGAAPRQSRWLPLLRGGRAVLNNPVGRLALRGTAGMGTAWMRSTTWPAACHTACRLLAPGFTRTNYVVVAERRL